MLNTALKIHYRHYNTRPDYCIILIVILIIYSISKNKKVRHKCYIKTFRIFYTNVQTAGFEKHCDIFKIHSSSRGE